MTHATTPFRRPARAILAPVAFLFVAVLSAAPAFSAVETYRLDPEHSHIGFKVRHFFSNVPGRFNKSEGTFAIDRDDYSKSSVKVTIESASIDTNEAARDKHLRSADFFDVEKHPKITFESKSVKAAGANKLSIEGTLTMRGVSKPVILDVDVLGFGPDAWGGFRGGFEGRTRVNRQDYGVSWNDVVEGGGAILGNDVDIVLNLELVRDKPKSAETKKTGR